MWSFGCTNHGCKERLNNQSDNSFWQPPNSASKIRNAAQIMRNNLKASGIITVLTFECVYLFLNEWTSTDRDGQWARETEEGDDASTDIIVVQLKQHHKTDGKSRKVPSTVRSPAETNSDRRRGRERTMERHFPSSSNLINVKQRKDSMGVFPLGNPTLLL